MLHWALFGGGSRSTKPCIFPCKVAAGGDERYLLCAAGAAGVVPRVLWCSYRVISNYNFSFTKVMKSYEVEQISTILSHFYNLEKLKNICFYCIENNIISNYSG